MKKSSGAESMIKSEAIVLGLGVCIPKKKVDNVELFDRIENFELEKAVLSLEKKGTDTSNLSKPEIFDLWVMQMCGIKCRPFASESEFNEGLVAEHMATIACENALLDAGILAAEVDHLLVSTYSTNRLMPSTACTVANELGLKDASVRTINGACSGFLDALIDAKIKVESGYFENVLVVAAENMSNKMNFSDPKSAVIFSDGAGACLVTKKSRAGESNTNRNFLSLLGFAAGTTFSEQVYMERLGDIFFNDGPYVQRNAVRTMAGVAEKALIATGLNYGDVNCIIPHQANARIIAAFDEKIRKERSAIFASAEKGETSPGKENEQLDSGYHTVNCIKQYGNLSSATVPVALFHYFGDTGLEKLNATTQPSNIVFTSVGGGYTYSAIVAQLVAGNV